MGLTSDRYAVTLFQMYLMKVGFERYSVVRPSANEPRTQIHER
jgi:hypothetical protein